MVDRDAMSPPAAPTPGAQEQLAFLLSLLESAHAHAIVALDAKGAIESWSHGAIILYGYEPTEIIGRNIEILWPDVKSTTEILQIARRAEHWEGEHVQARKDGARFLASISINTRHAVNGGAGGFTT